MLSISDHTAALFSLNRYHLFLGPKPNCLLHSVSPVTHSGVVGFFFSSFHYEQILLREHVYSGLFLHFKSAKCEKKHFMKQLLCHTL